MNDLQIKPFKTSPRQTPFAGRQHDLAILEDWHSHQPSKLLTITGVPGVGKTRLLHEWLSKITTPHCLVDLRGCFSELQLLEQLAVQLGVAITDNNPHARLVKALNGATLALDNAEHIIVEIRSFLKKLQMIGTIQVVVTSREALGIDGEIRHILQPFDVHTANSESHSSAITIFSYWLQHQHLETENNPYLEVLLQFTQGIPLMIELLAGQAGQFSLETISHLVERGATAELRHQSQIDDIHKDYERAVAWSCTLLEPDELEVFQHVSMFNTRFTVEDCLWILGDSWTIKAVTRCLLRLVEKNLLLQNYNTKTEPHFSWLVPIQSTIRGLLELQQQRNFERRHTEWVVHVLKDNQRNLILEEKQALETAENLLPEANYALERTKLCEETDVELPQLMIALVRYIEMSSVCGFGVPRLVFLLKHHWC